ncbi:ESF1 homolog [Ixodes scapularis]
MKGHQKIDDDRFKHIATDPRFRGVPKSQRKVKIDDRFAGMFDDKRFKLKYVMDKRGRPIHRTTSEDLKKYYAVSSSDSENDDDEEADDRSDQLADGPAEAVADELPGPSKSGQKQTKAKRNLDVKLRVPSTDDVGDETDDDDDSAVESEEESEQSSDDGEEEQERDPSRGVGNIETSSDEDDSGDESGEDSEPDVGWGELDRDAPKGDDVTRRLALCNLDWDKLKAQDLFVLLHSFLPPGGAVKGVTIYPSAFGKERMAQESVSGPSGLVESAPKKKVSTGKGDQTNGGERFDREALRKYQLDRLRYFYAVAECDSPETADHLYRELDGREYETSGTCLDLRFVPDDMTFDDEPSSVADSLPDPSTYTPISFVTSALQSVNVELTWDEGNPRRSQAIQRAFQGDGDAVGDDLRVYLASSSSEDEEETEEVGDTRAGGRKKQTAEAQIQKYRDLLKSLDGGPKEEEKADDVEMEVTWNPDLHKQVEDMVKKKLEQPEGQTPFAEFLQKRKEKHKMKKALNKKADAGENGEQAASGADDNDDVQQAFSDDDIPSDVDVNDDFFKEELESRKADKGGGAKKAKGNKAKPGKKQAAVGDTEAEKSKQAELELLLMDDEDDGRQHFSLQKLLDENQGSKRKKKKGRKEGNATESSAETAFQMDLADPRFSALYDSHHFSIDPTDRHFKKTKGMDALLTEKQKRRLAEPSAKPTQAKKPKVEEAGEPQPETKPETMSSQQSLASLASSVKFKLDERMKSRKKK